MTDFNPNFNALDSSIITGHIEELKTQTKQEKEQKTNNFPLEVYPKMVQDIIKDTSKNLGFPIDFIGASMLYAVSVAIGNTHRVEVKPGYQQSPVLYIALVGRAGTNKSHPLSFAIKPLQDHDTLTYNYYQREKKEYDRALSMPDNERKNQGINDLVKPVWHKLLLSDFTPEALAQVHNLNKRGVGIYVDELAGWFKNFNRYNKGSEMEFWLSAWSSKPLNIDRKTGESIFIPFPFVSVAGTIQNSLLNDLAKNNRSQNGFIDRILFAFPDKLKKEYWSENEVKQESLDNWQKIIKALLTMSVPTDETQNPIPEVLQFTPDAKRLLFNWQIKLTDQCNQPENEETSGIYSKLEMHAIRLALILQMMFYASGEGDNKAIGLEATKGALNLVEYFKNTALKVYHIVTDANPLEQLPQIQQSFYHALPDLFKTKDAVTIGKNFKVAERTAKRLLNNDKLFLRVKRGEYEKLV